jgi:hypothetical protein
MAPRLSPELALLYDQAKAKGNANRATLAVARQAGSVLDGYRSPPEGGQKRIRTIGWSFVKLGKTAAVENL